MMNFKGVICLSKISSILSVVVGSVLLAFLAVICVTDNTLVWQSRSDDVFIRVQDYDCREVECEDAPIGVMKEYTFTVSETLDSDAHLAFYTVHQYVDVYLNEKHVYSLKPSEGYRISRTVGSNWVMIPLYSEDAGKEARVEITPVYESFRGREVDFLIGSQLGIYVDRLSRDLPQLILGIIAVFVGLVFLGISGYNLLNKRREAGLSALGMFALMMGIWRLTDTRFTPFILSDKPVFLFYVSIAMLMIGTVPLIKSMEARFSEVSHRIFDIYCIVAVLICLVQVLLQMFGIMDVRDNLFVTHIMIAVGAGIIIFNVIFERFRHPESQKKRVGRKLPLICVVGVLADVFAFYIKGTSSGLLFSLTALLVYVVSTGIFIMFKYNDQERELAEKDRLLAENERQLTESRIATMISQIQPHFIYNSLNSIYYLCAKDTHMAQQAINDFSDYLQRSLHAIDRTSPISFEEELKHVKTYLKLEQMRFGEDVNVVYHIETTAFFVPALSVQPLVENAVKHGICPKDDGGTVTLTARERAEYFEIIVDDDGVGFDPEQESEGKETHIGIKNVRQRLQMMCNATLEIESEPGKGTTSTIRIPKEKDS